MSTPSIRQIRDDAERWRKDQQAELVLARQRASNWAKGVGALIAAGLAFSLIKGRSELGDLIPLAAAGVGILLLISLVLGVVAAYFLFRSAYGRLDSVPPGTTDHAIAVRTIGDLRVGLRLAGAGAAAILAGVALTWYGPAAEGPRLKVVDAQGMTWCGEPIRALSGTLTMKIDGQEVSVDLSTALVIAPITTCP